ncbi:dethiobiotin synthase [Marinobacterium rhizophilum]|uniref:ATP-dependent dethiobiotin synthetase BioD n=1 Tax=Marinobacterium rhizophilum TaxID=420402 RepID=A0ABY5HQL9_9GAMM|nr:dethiobiotin synthase [Marinobacterium rhizophilum]UTW14186.1 dethiobiotin synthase [Marinobacterium rhizophilum]
MAKHNFFVAGTDTDAGKTLVTTGILQAANRLGLQTIGLKPVAAGCEQTPEGLRNDDALKLQAAASIKLSYEAVNPIALPAAIAPHIAAMQVGRSLSADRIAALCRGSMMQRADLLLIEGAGGWRVPLNGREMLSRVPQLLETPVILVIGMKLGCINHALLSAEAIVRDGLRIAGWVANRIDPRMACYDENLATLGGFLQAPLLGEVPYLDNPTPEAVADCLDLSPLLTER